MEPITIEKIYAQNTKNRKESGRKAAVRATELSELKAHKVGAALFKGNKQIALGWNCKKTHPKRKTEWSQHAEFNVFVALKKHLIEGCDLYIARVTKTGRVKNSKPCKDCRAFLSMLKLNKIFYTNDLGDIEQLVQ